MWGGKALGIKGSSADRLLLIRDRMKRDSTWTRTRSTVEYKKHPSNHTRRAVRMNRQSTEAKKKKKKKKKKKLYLSKGSPVRSGPPRGCGESIKPSPPVEFHSPRLGQSVCEQCNIALNGHEQLCKNNAGRRIMGEFAK
jgi:hypothetical protein